MSTEQPTGRTQIKWFARGYQEALHDIASAYLEGGEDAVQTWLENNMTGTVTVDDRQYAVMGGELRQVSGP